MSHPISNLLRAYCADDAAEYRASEDGPDILSGHFATFDDWTVINSRYEGHFLERIAPGAFDDTIRGRSIPVLFQHGSDPTVGEKPLGDIVSLRSDARGMAYEVALYDSGYVNELKPAFRSGMGASFKFSVVDEEWVTPSRAADHNPDRLPERTLTNVHLYEFGPVVFPAYANATAGMRSVTDDFYDDPLNIAALTERVGLAVVRKILAELQVGDRTATPEQTDEAGGLDVAHSIARRQWMAATLYSL